MNNFGKVNIPEGVYIDVHLVLSNSKIRPTVSMITEDILTDYNAFWLMVKPRIPTIILLITPVPTDEQMIFVHHS
jgi:hypothetical protein